MSQQRAASPSGASPKEAGRVTCLICMEVFPYNETQQLSCQHRFCSGCMGLSLNLPTCAMPGCSAVRNADVTVDEIDDGAESCEIQHIRFGPSTLQLEERQRCEVPRANLQCVNVARITLVDCNHRVCLDCLAKRITQSDLLGERPRCPIPRCANYLSRNEVMLVSEKVLSIAPIFERIGRYIPNVGEELKDELRLYCSVYGSFDTAKCVNIPKICTLGDMANAIMQILMVDRNRTASSIGIYARTGASGPNSKIRYEPVNIKTMAKKTIKDSTITDKTHIVLDLNNELKRH